MCARTRRWRRRHHQQGRPPPLASDADRDRRPAGARSRPPGPGHGRISPGAGGRRRRRWPATRAGLDSARGAAIADGEGLDAAAAGPPGGPLGARAPVATTMSTAAPGYCARRGVRRADRREPARTAARARPAATARATRLRERHGLRGQRAGARRPEHEAAAGETPSRSLTAVLRGWGPGGRRRRPRRARVSHTPPLRAARDERGLRGPGPRLDTSFERLSHRWRGLAYRSMTSTLPRRDWKRLGHHRAVGLQAQQRGGLQLGRQGVELVAGGGQAEAAHVAGQRKRRSGGYAARVSVLV